MRAITVTEFGGPERLRWSSAPDPVPAPGQCLIEVAVCDVLFLDAMLRAGLGQGPMRPQLPWIPGNGVAGRIVAVGDGGDESLVGRLVGAHTGGRGAYAQRTVAGAEDVVPIPDGVDLPTAAALLHDGVTALRLAEVTGVTADDVVLVLGASGGLGIALVQLARARGARVVAVARDPAKRARIAAIGPDAVVDPADPDWLGRVGAALGPGGATVIFDNVGPELGAPALALIADGGRFSAHGTHDAQSFTWPDPDTIAQRHATVTGIAEVQLDGARFAELTARAFTAAAAGELAPVIGQTFALAHAADAHRALEARSVFGKTLLTVDL